MKLKGLRLNDLLWFSLPSIASAVVEPIAGIVDTAFVGHYDTRSLAAMTVAIAIMSTFTWMFNFIAQASTQAMANGKVLQSSELLQERVKISLLTSLVVGVVSSIFLYSLHRPLFLFLGGQESLFRPFWSYYEVRVLGHFITVVAITSLSLLRGLSKLYTVLFLMMLTTGLNIILSYTFLYKFGLGLTGVAWGTVISYCIVLLSSLIILIRDPRLGFHFFTIETRRGNWLSFGSHTLSLFGRSFFLSGSFFVMVKMAGRLGEAELAAHQITLQLWLFISYFLDGFALTGSILGGKYFFLGYKKRTKLIYSQLLKMSFTIGIIATCVFYFFPAYLISIFTNDHAVKIVLESVWPVIVFSMIFNTFAFMLDGLAFGIEAFSFVAKNMVFGCLIIFLPFALYSIYDPQLFWIWLAMSLLSFYRFVSGIVYLRRRLQ